LIVVLDRPAAINATITRADARHDVDSRAAGGGEVDQRLTLGGGVAGNARLP
jgi:hypothetical protein